MIVLPNNMLGASAFTVSELLSLAKATETQKFGGSGCVFPHK